MTWETVKIEGAGAVRRLVLNRPRAHNAVNAQLLSELIQACALLDDDPDCRVVILQGEGASFCAGADLKEGLTHGALKRDMIRRARLGRKAVNALSDLTPVTIAAVHGHAIGGGACFAAACDFRIGAETCSVSVREASLGLSLSWNSIPNFVHLVGPSKAKEMIMFGEAYAAQTLLGYGFFDQVVPETDLSAAADAWAARVVRQPPLPIQMTKASINALVKVLDRGVFHLDDYGLALTGGSQNAATARTSFFEGGEPDWEQE